MANLKTDCTSHKTHKYLSRAVISKVNLLSIESDIFLYNKT